MFDTRYMSSPMRARQYIQQMYGANMKSTQVMRKHFEREVDCTIWVRKMRGVPGFELLSRVKTITGYRLTVDVTYRAMA